MNIELKQGFFKNVLEPVTPDLELPYTEEESQPLPPEDEEDEEMTNGAVAENHDKVAEDEPRVEIDWSWRNSPCRRRSWVGQLF